MQNTHYNEIYTTDYYNSMKEKEVESIKTYYFVGVVYNPKLTYLKYRNMLLSWVDNACVSFGYPITVKGLTAEY